MSGYEALPKEILYSISEFCDLDEKICILQGLESEYIISSVEKVYPNYPWHLELHVIHERMKDITIHKNAMYYMLVKREAYNVLHNYIVPGSKVKSNINGKISFSGCIQLSRDGLAIGPYIIVDGHLRSVYDPEITKINGMNPHSVPDCDDDKVPIVLYRHGNKALSRYKEDYVPIRCEYNRYGRYDPWYDMNFNPTSWRDDSDTMPGRSILDRDVVHKQVFSKTVSDIDVVNHLRLRKIQIKDIFRRIDEWKAAERELMGISDELALFFLYCANNGYVSVMRSHGSLFSVNHPNTDQSREHIGRIHAALLQHPQSYQSAIVGDMLILSITKSSEITRFKLIMRMLNMNNMVTKKINPCLRGLHRYKSYRYHIPFKHKGTRTPGVIPDDIINRYGSHHGGVIL